METRLERLCKVFGWSGGTIFQAREELENALEINIDTGFSSGSLVSMPDDKFEELFEELKRVYPSYKAYLKEIYKDTENYGGDE